MHQRGAENGRAARPMLRFGRFAGIHRTVGNLRENDLATFQASPLRIQMAAQFWLTTAATSRLPANHPPEPKGHPLRWPSTLCLDPLQAKGGRFGYLTMPEENPRPTTGVQEPIPPPLTHTTSPPRVTIIVIFLARRLRLGARTLWRWSSLAFRLDSKPQSFW